MVFAVLFELGTEGSQSEGWGSEGVCLSVCLSVVKLPTPMHHLSILIDITKGGKGAHLHIRYK